MRIAVPLANSKTQYFVNQAYVEYVAGAGYIPIPVVPEADMEEIASLCDGLLIPGGIDIDPIYYGYDNASSQSVDPVRDEFERGIFHSFVEQKKPVFGICRGHQLICREFLHMNSEFDKVLEFEEHINHHNQVNNNVDRVFKSHFVQFLPNLLYGAKDKTPFSLAVNSMHHQALSISVDKKTLNNGFPYDLGKLKILAWTDRGFNNDKGTYCGFVIEAVSVDWDGSKVMGVQWHPEELKDYKLLNNFFGKAKERKYENTR